MTAIGGKAMAQESADVVLIGNNLLKVAETLNIARRCRRIILQNFYGTLIVDSTGIAPCRDRRPHPSARGLHSRLFGDDVHSQFHPALAFEVRFAAMNSWSEAEISLGLTRFSSAVNM
jgi:hypothetical protein